MSLMEAHELAIAALSQVSRTPSHRRDSGPGNVASARSNANDATAARVEHSAPNNSIDASYPTNQAYPQMVSDGQAGAESDDGQVYHANGEPLQSTSSDNSQDTTDGHDTASTPPTSEGFSSQSTNPDGLSQLSQLSQLAAAQQPLASTSTTRPSVVIPTAGLKRTADGQFKSPASPNGAYRPGHARNTSMISNASTATSRSVAELASEMRTRFSYAMVKVNNGWTTNSIDEVESLASQAGSPTSSNSTLHGRRSLITSPRTAIANVQGKNSTIAMHNHLTSRSLPSDFDLYPNNQQPSRTYESFWQDHSTRIPQNRQYTNAPGISPPNPKLSLAPPADIRPTAHSRRSDPKFSKPPAIPGHSRSNLSQSSHHSFSNSPRTPQRDFTHDAPIQTPTQKTLQEQDAIETLLFMSSPGNSGNMGPAFPPRTQASPPQTSPLKHEFGSQLRGAQGRRVGFEKVSNGTGSDVGSYNTGRRKMKQSPRDINKLLDEMGDSSSDDEVMVVPKFSSPRRTRI